MNKRQYALMLILAALASLAGGALSSRFFTVSPAAYAKRTPYSQIFAAEKFFLRDLDGQIRAGLVFDKLPEGGPSFVLFDKDGRLRAEMSLLSNGTPGLTLYHEVSQRSTPFTVERESSSLKLLVEQGRPFAEFSIQPMAKSISTSLADKLR